jgi:BspA type Leucine rich repeat region (6 copies)/Concanavalin A-like lectin/glucanases superfamily/Immunoglobulin I-set domain
MARTDWTGKLATFTLLLLTLPSVVQAQFAYTTNNSHITITKYTGSGSVVTIPDTIDGLLVTSIGNQAFFESTSLTRINIPFSVTSIGNAAFYSCTRLTSVTIPPSYEGGVTSIGSYAFESCTSLTNVTIPNSVTRIADWTFHGCTSLTNITIPSSVTSIGGYAFFSCTNLTSITIPNSVTSVEGDAFYSCTSLTNVTIPTSVTNIEGGAFSGCTSLTSITIPTSVTSIEGYALYNCTSLTNVTIPNGITCIKERAFSGCTSLTSITIPNSVSIIGGYAFESCASLTGVYFQGNAPTVDSTVFTGDDNTTVYYLPGGTGWPTTLGGRPTVAAPSGPRITKQPDSITTTPGSTATFQVIADGTPLLRYQWQHDGSDLPGATSSSLSLANVGSSDAGQYRVSVANSSGSVTSAVATLTVLSNQATAANQVLLFDSSPSAQVVIQSADDLQSPNEITVEAWFQPLKVTPGIYSAIISKEDGINATSQRSYELRWFPDGKVYGIFFLAGSTYASVSAPLALGQWTHVAASFSSTEGAVRLFTNGVLAATATKTDDEHQSLTGMTVRQTSLPLIFGHFDPYPNTALEGSLDEVRVWTSCRTAAEIAGNLGCRLSGSESGLAGYWNFDQGNLNDLTGHGHNGSLVGTVRVSPLTGDDVIYAGCNQLRIAGRITTDHQAEVSFVPVAGKSYVIQGSVDLERWTVLTTITNSQSTVEFREPLASSSGRRFYRVLQP